MHDSDLKHFFFYFIFREEKKERKDNINHVYNENITKGKRREITKLPKLQKKRDNCDILIEYDRY